MGMEKDQYDKTVYIICLALDKCILPGGQVTFLETFLALKTNSLSLPNANNAKPIPSVNFNPRPQHPVLTYPICTISHNAGKESSDRQGLLAQYGF
jgi:hypothetical protein